jgi:hypothetical protein
MGSGPPEVAGIVEVLELEDGNADPVKYEKVAVSDDSESDEDESLEIVMQKVSARTCAASPPRPPAPRVLTPQKRVSPVVWKPKLDGSIEKWRSRRPQTDPSRGRALDHTRRPGPDAPEPAKP